MKNFANEEGLSVSSVSYRGTLKTLVNYKMRVLRDFYIVDDNNEEEIRAYLEQALEKHPNRDPQTVLDQAASPLIKKKFRED